MTARTRSRTKPGKSASPGPRLLRVSFPRNDSPPSYWAALLDGELVRTPDALAEKLGITIEEAERRIKAAPKAKVGSAGVDGAVMAYSAYLAYDPELKLGHLECWIDQGNEPFIEEAVTDEKSLRAQLVDALRAADEDGAGSAGERPVPKSRYKIDVYR